MEPGNKSVSTNDCAKAKEEFKFKHLENKTKDVLQSCLAMASELETTIQIINFGQERPMDCVNKEEPSPQPQNRYYGMAEQLEEITNSLNKTRDRIKTFKEFFEE